MLKRLRFKVLDEALMARFVLPVVFENTLTIFVGMAISQVISTVSPSALAATGMANSVITVVTAVFSMVTTGSSILVARQVGAAAYDEASDTIEQSVFLSVTATTAVAALCIVTATPTLRLLMPTAEDALFAEAVRYYTVVMLSLPLAVLITVLGGVCRSLGDSRAPMATALVVNFSQLVLSWGLVGGLGLQEMGAGLAIVLCRLTGTAVIFWVMLRRSGFCELKVARMLRPNLQTCRRILRVGLPVSMESIFVNLGYMLANSMAISLGTFASGVNQILNTVNTFTSVPWGIGGTVAMAAVGHLLGAKRYKDARKSGWQVWGAGMVACLLLGTLACLFAEPLCRLYSSDEATVQESARLLWVLIPLGLVGMSVNAVDPQLRAGGDVTFVMLISLVVVWGIRLPLTWLFCFVLDMGVMGIYLANIIAVGARAVVGLIRVCGTKWMYKRV